MNAAVVLIVVEVGRAQDVAAEGVDGVKQHIVPGLGEHLVSKVERKDILKFQFELGDMPTVAYRCVDLLGKMFDMSALREIRPPGRSPCKWVRSHRVDPHKERILTAKELARLGHRNVQTTARYAHRARDSVKASKARVAESLRVDLAGRSDIGGSA